jgi:hypothetical protein
MLRTVNLDKLFTGRRKIDKGGFSVIEKALSTKHNIYVAIKHSVKVNLFII